MRSASIDNQYACGRTHWTTLMIKSLERALSLLLFSYSLVNVMLITSKSPNGRELVNTDNPPPIRDVCNHSEVKTTNGRHLLKRLFDDCVNRILAGIRQATALKNG